MFAVFEDASPLVEPLSIDEAFLDVRGHAAARGHRPRRSPSRLRSDVRERVGLPITVGVARTKFLAKVASGVAKPDGLLVVDARPRARRSSTRSRSSGSGASAGDGPKAARGQARSRSATSPGSARRRWSPCSVADRAGSSTRCRRTTTRGGCRPRSPSRLDRRAARARPLVDARPRRSTPSLVALVDRITRRMRAAGASGAPSSCGFASATSRGRRAVTRCRARRRRRSRSSRRRGRCSRRLAPRSRREGLTLVGISVANLETTTPCSSCCRSPTTGRTRSMRRSTPCATASAPPRSPAAFSSAATAASRCRTCRTQIYRQSAVVETRPSYATLLAKAPPKSGER